MTDYAKYREVHCLDRTEADYMQDPTLYKHAVCGADLSPVGMWWDFAPAFVQNNYQDYDQHTCPKCEERAEDIALLLLSSME